MSQFEDNERNKNIVEEIFSILNGENKVRFSDLRFVFCKNYPEIRIELTPEERVEHLSRKLIRSNLADRFFSDLLSETSKYKSFFKDSSFNEYFWFSDVILNGSNQFQHRIVDYLKQNKLLKRFCSQKDDSGLTVLHHLLMKSQHPSIISKTFYLMNSTGEEERFDVFRELKIDTKYLQGVIYKSIRRENIYCLSLIFEILIAQFCGENEDFFLEDRIDWFSILSKACISSSAKSLQFLFQTMKKFHIKRYIDMYRLFAKFHENVTNELTSQSPNHQETGKKIGLLEIVLKNEKISWENEKMNFCCLILENFQPRAKKNEINIINSESFKTVNYENFTPLHYVVAHNSSDLTRLFLKYGGDLNTVCWKRKGSIKHSVGRTSQDDSFDINEEEEEEEPEQKGEIVTQTPVSLGIYLNCKLEIIELLINQGANISQISTTRKNNPMILALENNRLDIVELLFRNGVDLTVREDGTILHYLSDHPSRFGKLKFVLGLVSSSDEGETHVGMNNRLPGISQMRDENGLTSLDVLNRTIEEYEKKEEGGQIRNARTSKTKLSSLINYLVERMTRFMGSFHPRQQTTTSSTFSPSTRKKRKKKKVRTTTLGYDDSDVKSSDSFYGHTFEYRESFLWKMLKSEFGGGGSRGKSVIKSPCFGVYFYSFFLRFFFFDDGKRFRVKVGCSNHEFFYNLYLDYQIYYRKSTTSSSSSPPKKGETRKKKQHQNLELLCEEKEVEVTNQLILRKNDWKSRCSRQENETYDEEMVFEINSVDESNQFRVHKDSVLVGSKDGGGFSQDELDDETNIVNCSTDSIVFLNTEDEELKSSDHFMTDSILEGSSDTNSVLLKITFLKLRVEYNRNMKK